jgi:hypothetical protein
MTTICRGGSAKAAYFTAKATRTSSRTRSVQPEAAGAGANAAAGAGAAAAVGGASVTAGFSRRRRHSGLGWFRRGRGGASDGVGSLRLASITGFAGGGGALAVHRRRRASLRARLEASFRLLRLLRRRRRGSDAGACFRAKPQPRLFFRRQLWHARRIDVRGMVPGARDSASSDRP